METAFLNVLLKHFHSLLEVDKAGVLCGLYLSFLELWCVHC
ncbi:unnamed protein product [Prunus brigantina]